VCLACVALSLSLQDLTELFITHQIPSDLLSFAGPADADQTTRLAAVKGHVAALHALIKKSEERTIAHHNRQLQAEAEAPPGAFGFGACPLPFAPPPPPAPACFAAAAVAASPPHMAPRMMKKSAPMFGAAPAAASGAFGGGVGGLFSASHALARSPPLSGALGPAGAAASDAAASAAAKPAASAGGVRGAAAQPGTFGADADAEADEGAEADASGGAGGRDLTKVPAALDAAFERLDHDNALRPTVITPASPWAKKSQASLLARSLTEATLHEDAQRDAKAAAFDLLDALSRSGALTMEHAALHVLLGATHCFDDALVDVVCAQSVNPIEKVERSTVIMASTIHGLPPAALLRREQLARIEGHSPALFAPAAAE
jgi:hypothetical protein